MRLYRVFVPALDLQICLVSFSRRKSGIMSSKLPSSEDQEQASTAMSPNGQTQTQSLLKQKSLHLPIPTFPGLNLNSPTHPSSNVNVGQAGGGDNGATALNVTTTSQIFASTPYTSSPNDEEVKILRTL
jgi:hypothetical protein